MDALIISNLLKKSLKKNKNIEHLHDDSEYSDSMMDYSNVSVLSFIVMIVINSYAAYLSWECNTANNYPLNLKIIFSFLSFMFGSLYIVYYILFRFDTCNKF
jgi:hypothetical protein